MPLEEEPVRYNGIMLLEKSEPTNKVFDDDENESSRVDDYDSNDNKSTELMKRRRARARKI
jgi:hypothetical protein